MDMQYNCIANLVKETELYENTVDLSSKAESRHEMNIVRTLIFIQEVQFQNVQYAFQIKRPIFSVRCITRYYFGIILK